MTLAQYALLGLLTDDGSPGLVLTCGLEDSPDRTIAVAGFSAAASLDRLRTGRLSILRHNPTGRPEALGLPANSPAVFSYLEVALASPGRVHGWLGMANKLGAPMFTEEDAMVAATLGVQAGIAFENARLVEELKRQAAALEQEAVSRARVEEQLRVNEERLRQLADAMPQIVWSADAVGVIDYYNRRWHELAGTSRQDRRTVEDWISMLHPDDRAATRQAWTTALDAGELCQVEFRFYDRAVSRYRWFLGRAVPVADTSGKLLRWFGTWTDIDSQKQTEQRLRETSRARDEFLAVVSHELRTPLHTMLGWSRILTSVLHSEEQKDRVLKERAHETIRRSGLTLEHLINDLIDLAGVTAGNARLEHQPVSLSAVVAAAIDSLQLAISGKKIGLTVELDRTVGPVQGDFNRLRQVVWNVLSNAIKFTPPGGAVHIRLQPTAMSARLSVTDTGVGIPAAFLPFVFERFRQADSTATRAYGGLGLGLAIARHFVELHGGTIEVESAGEGSGACFSVNLPVLADRAGASPISLHPAAPRIHDGISADRQPLHGARILVVDDDRDTRDLLLLVLERAGASVTAVGSAADALERLSTQQFTALLSDVAMPDEDGCALMTRIRGMAAQDAAVLPAIALTGYARPEDRERVLAAGFQKCLTKPIDPPELVASMVALIQ